MEEKILELIRKNPKTFNEILKKNYFIGNSSGKKLNKVLQNLINNEKIYFQRRTSTYNIKDQEIFIGIFKSTKHEFAFVEKDNFSIFIPGQFKSSAFEGDTVKVLLFPLKDDSDKDRRAGKVIRIMKRNGNNIIFKATKKDKKIILLPDDFEIKSETSFINLNEYNNIKEGDIFSCIFNDYINKKVLIKIMKYIGNIHDPKVDYLITGLKHNLKTNFSKKELKDFEDSKINKADKTVRKDLTNLMTITIDGETSKDLDDAITVEKLKNNNFKLYVHIADVAHYIKKDSELDISAYEQSTSIYLINKVFPMFPKKLSNDLCSLNPNIKKLTLTCMIEIDCKGKIINYDVFESIIESNYRLTYKDVDNFLENKTSIIEGNKELKALINNAFELSKILRYVKSKKGMIDFNFSEILVNLDENDNPVSLMSKRQTLSEKIIEDLMVVTNETIAGIFVKKKIPSMFRVHDKPKLDNIGNYLNLLKTLNIEFNKNAKEVTPMDLSLLLKETNDSPSSLIIKRYLIQAMEKAIYDYSNVGHYALGLNNYLHFTSPIRRYPDLIVHRILKEIIIPNKKMEESEIFDLIDYLKDTTTHCSKMEREAMTIERNYMDIKKSRLMEEEIGKVFSGNIVSFSKFGIYIDLDNLTNVVIPFESLINDSYYFNEEKMMAIGKNTNHSYKLSQKLNVKIQSVDISKGFIRGIIV